MAITVLAVVFLLLILITAFFGQRLLSRKAESAKATALEQCAICRNTFEKEELVERQIGDIKIHYFCSNCIKSLSKDISEKMKKPIHS